MDKRKRLGDGSGQAESGEYRNRLPGPYPGVMPAKPEIEYSGDGNPAICSNRPIADMQANVGSGDIKEGTAFRIPMGEPMYDDPDYR